MGDRSGHNDNHTSSSHDLVFVLSVCLVVIEIMGLLCNGIILTVYYKYSRLRTATNLFILNLAVCNLFLAVLQLMLSSPSYFNKEWLYGYNGCVAYGFLHQCLTSVSVATLAVIAFDRFCVITKPVRKFQTFIITKSRARVLICITHVYSFVFTFPLLVGWNELTPDKRHQTGCYIHYSNRSPSPMAYTITSTIFTCILPFIITSCCYARIYKSVRSSAQKSTLHVSKQKTILKNTGLPCSRKKSLYHTRTARMIAIVMFFFLLTWLPTKITGLLVAFGCSVSPLAVYLSVFLAKSCVMYNAVVYVFLNHRFRAAFLHLTFVCREDSRLRFTTSVTNVSGRFVEILPSVAENCDRSRVLTRKTLSQLSFIPNPDIPDVLATSCRISAVDSSRACRDLSETLRKDTSLPTRHQSDAFRDADGLESTVWSRNGSCLNRGLQREAFGERGSKSEEIGQQLPGVGKETSKAKYQQSTVGRNPAKTSYGFNNPGLRHKDEHPDDEKYLELNINSLGMV